jgi:pyroglutamyl-peptidase
MNNILCTGFKGDINSSKILLDNLSKNINFDSLYFDNDFEESEKQLKDKIKGNKYDFIFSFGQKPVIKKIYIEKTGINGLKKLETNYNYMGLKIYLEKYFRIKISENAGKYLCNNIYYKGLKYIFDNKLKTKMIFIHIPYLDNIDIKYFSKIIIYYIENILNNEL